MEQDSMWNVYIVLKILWFFLLTHFYFQFSLQLLSYILHSVFPVQLEIFPHLPRTRSSSYQICSLLTKHLWPETWQANGNTRSGNREPKTITYYLKSCMEWWILSCLILNISGEIHILPGCYSHMAIRTIHPAKQREPTSVRLVVVLSSLVKNVA